LLHQTKPFDPTIRSLKVKNLEDVPIVKEYLDVFPEELSGMPPHRKIEFIIDLASITAPIAKRPYRMAATELAELKKQLNDLSRRATYDLAHHPGEHRSYL
jgi:hypothetical protein